MHTYDRLQGSILIIFGLILLVAVASTFLFKIALICVAISLIRYGFKLMAGNVHRF